MAVWRKTGSTLLRIYALRRETKCGQGVKVGGQGSRLAKRDACATRSRSVAATRATTARQMKSYSIPRIRFGQLLSQQALCDVGLTHVARLEGECRRPTHGRNDDAIAPESAHLSLLLTTTSHVAFVDCKVPRCYYPPRKQTRRSAGSRPRIP